MKIKLHLFILMIILTQTTPTHAMLTRLSLLTTRSNLNFSSRLTQQYNPTLLARTLASHRADNPFGYQNSYQDDDKSKNNGKQNENQSWWQYFRARFARNKASSMLGFSFFGYHLFWSNDDICQTPEDFHNPAKLKRTKEYYLANGADKVFQLFIQNFDTLKNDPYSQTKTLEFLWAYFF